MLAVSPSQIMALGEALAFFQRLARPNGPAFEPSLLAGWERAGRAVGLRGSPVNPRNSLIRNSRLFLASSPLKETGLALFLRDTYDSGNLYLAPSFGLLPSALRLEMPDVFRSYPHCTNPLADNDLSWLTVHAMDGGNRIHSRAFARLKDLWRPSHIGIDHDCVQAMVSRPAELAVLGALSVSPPFDCSDIRFAPSPLARFILGREGLEGALAAKSLGMNWIVAVEDASIRLPPGSVMSHGPL